MSNVPKRRLGRTGHDVSIVGLGGFHVGKMEDAAEAERVVRAAIDRGITFLDNCWDYNDGQSEERMGRALAGVRDRVVLMTKIDGRTRSSAAQQLEQSLRRLRTDVVDLVQIHEIIRFDDPARCFAAGGAIEALVEARTAGKLRWIGFTGHKDADVHLAMLAAADAHGFTFDAVQMPLNVLDAHHRSFEKKVLPVLVEKGIAVLGMKPLAAGKIPAKTDVTGPEALRYALSLPTSVVITGIDGMDTLDQAIATASSFAPMTPTEIAALLERTRAAATDGTLERYKSSGDHDGTEKNPHWLEIAQLAPP
jgi:aryl-alcohol dehydrogenase-like predicted oxidoreductase